MPKTPRRSAPPRQPGPESLANSGAFYALVFAQSPVPMWVVDGATLTFLAVNDAAVRDSGYTRSELLDLTVPALCPPEDLAIALTADLEPFALSLAQAQPCGLILNELLTNAVTHAFPEGRSGMVTMELRDSSEGSVMLRVIDTGVGVPATLDIHQPTRLGWQLVTILTQQLHGELVLERDRGTRITVRWPR